MESPGGGAASQQPGDRDTPVATLKARVRRFVEARDWDQFHTPKDLAIGLAVEAAELLEHFRFRGDAEMAARLRDPRRRTEVAHELADVLYFVLLMCANLGFDATTILDEKLAESAGKYPVARARGVNEKYTDLGTRTAAPGGASGTAATRAEGGSDIDEETP